MKKNYFILAALTLGLTACDNYFDATYMDNADPQQVVVATIEYTLTSDDYKTIADNGVNKTYAANLDSINETDIYTTSLKSVGEKRCFNEMASADMYVPAFIYNKYPQMDPGSICNVTYLTFEGLPTYLDFYNQTIQYELKGKDYKAIYGDETNYLTPANEDQVVLFLPMVDDDYLCGVKYNYAEVAGGPVSTKEVLYQYKDGVTWVVYASEDVNAQILPASANGQAVNWLTNTCPYAVADQVVVLMTYDSKTKFYAATEYIFDGTTWNETTGIIEESMSFLLKEGWAANLSTYYQQAVAGEANQGKIVTQDVLLTGSLSYVWSFQSSYGMVGNAYYGGGPNVAEGWCILPKIRLKNSVAPALSFDHAQNYVTDDIRFEQLTVWVSTDYTDDVKTATWTQLPWNVDEATGKIIFPSGSDWTYVNSGRMDLSAWNGQTIYIGFRYKTEEGQANPKWEIKNILVNEPEESEE